MAALAALAAALLVPAGALAAAATNAMKSFAAGNNEFACVLYHKLRTNEGNLFFSPFSISTCLAMTGAGARGETAQQMAQVLHFGTNQARIHALFAGLLTNVNEIQSRKEVELNTANAVWAQKTHPFLPEFLKTVEQDYGAMLKQADFTTSAENTRKEINSWVSDKTSGRIANLMPAGVINAMTRLVLVNAIYFKGKWAHQFTASNTTEAPFKIDTNKVVQAKLMNVTANFKYASVNSLQILELPYQGGELSMFVLLPTTPAALRVMESLMSEQPLSVWFSLPKEQKVNVYLPKFKTTGQFSLAPTLSEMGMDKAFSDAADFSGMDGAKDLHISAVVHKAFVEVNEEGTEAAAATGIAVATHAMIDQPPVPVFRADHPFVFVIRENRTGNILFLGRMMDPTQ